MNYFPTFTQLIFPEKLLKAMTPIHFILLSLIIFLSFLVADIFPS